jgi:hypothetical protein
LSLGAGDTALEGCLPFALAEGGNCTVTMSLSDLVGGDEICPYSGRSYRHRIVQRALRMRLVSHQVRQTAHTLWLRLISL